MRFHHFLSCFIASQNLESLFMMFILSSRFMEFHTISSFPSLLITFILFSTVITSHCQINYRGKRRHMLYPNLCPGFAIGGAALPPTPSRFFFKEQTYAQRINKEISIKKQTFVLRIIGTRTKGKRQASKKTYLVVVVVVVVVAVVVVVVVAAAAVVVVVVVSTTAQILLVAELR